MPFDNSRLTFDPWKDYAGVVMEQGRVQTDADWNEGLAEQARRTRAATLDTLGHAVYPQTTPNAFKIDADTTAGGQSIRIGLGRMYVDGILVENHGKQSTAVWDPALAELSNTPQPQPGTPQTLDSTNSILFEDQPYGSSVKAPTTPGAYVAYLDVWERPITYIEDSSLIDIAIGVDTTGRVQTAWRVGLLPLPGLAIAGSVTSGAFSPGDQITQAVTGATAVVLGTVPSSGPMMIGQLAGAPNATDVWSNTGGAEFKPTAAPAGSATYIDGSVTSGAFQSGETVVQSSTGASAMLSETVPAPGPMIVGPISGSPASTAPWIGKTSGAVFTPVSTPSLSSSAIAGSVTSGAFLSNEQVVQAASNASATVIGLVPGSGPLVVGGITGTPDATDNWVGQTSKAVFAPSGAPAPSSWTCSSSDDSLPWPVSSGLLTTQPASSVQTGPCCLTTGNGYTGPENQLYRIQVHTPGGVAGAGATFKWSRENASVQTSVSAIGSASNTLGGPANSLSVQSLGRDQVLGFKAGDWIEITDEFHDNYCLPGELYQIDRVDVPSTSIILTTQLSSNFSSTTLGNNAYTRITRWDQSGQVYKMVGGKQQPYYNLDATATSASLPNGCAGIPIPADGSPVVLESGIAIVFGLSLANGSYQAMDYWSFTARTADGSIEPLTNAPPRGLAHHFTKLSIVTIPASGAASATDCRSAWPPASSSEECSCCCSCTVGDGSNSFGKFTSIQKAIDSLTGGGEVCILAGDFYEQVFIKERRNIVIHGCGSQTRVWSPSLNPSLTSPAQNSGGSTAINVPAVFSIAHSANIQLHSFSIFADDGNIGVLMDRLPAAGALNQPANIHVDLVSNSYIKLTDLKVSASNMQAIAALAVAGLEIDENQVAMRAVASLFPAVYLSGENIRFERNQVSIESNLDRILYTFQRQSPAGFNSQISGMETNSVASAKQKGVLAIGGVQVGGPSSNIWIVENQITGGSRNGITLGNIIYLDPNGNDNGTLAGILIDYEANCAQGGSGSIPGTHQIGGNPTPVAAGGAIHNLHIVRNTIRDTGMCGIGPVGFFDLTTVKEIVSLTNVLIAENILVHTLARNVVPAAINVSPYGYGVISLPDVQNLIVCDNIVSDYGISPGAEVCGIYVYHGEGVEIGRNRIRESRDLSLSNTLAYTTYGGKRAGIFIEHVAPPTLDTTANSLWVKSIAEARQIDVNETFRVQPPSYVPGIPALRIADNTVRVAWGLALYALGFGSFSVLGNHFATGGAVSADSAALRASEFAQTAQSVQSSEFAKDSLTSVDTPAAALTVAIVNLGVAVEVFDLIQSFAALFNSNANSVNLTGDALAVTNGTVQFSNNNCQLITQLNRMSGLCSVGIVSLDQVQCSANELWINGRKFSVLTDALLMGISMQVVGNRFQESLSSVIYSGFTFGLSNISSNNICSYCLIPIALKKQWLVKTSNVILNAALCKDLVAG